MGNGQQNFIQPTNGNLLPNVLPGNEQTPVNRTIPLPINQSPQNDPKENATLLFDQRWQNSQAAGLRNQLAAMIFGGANAANIAPAEINSLVQRAVEQAQTLLNHSWETLITAAREHADLQAFRDKPQEFWNSVRQMSEVRLVESFINGELKPQVVSRYGELLEQFNRSGGRMETFLASLPPGEREVFQARYQINQTFGASELFAGGRGIALDENGQFPLRVFLSSNNIAADFPLLRSALGLGLSNLSAEEIQLLLNSQFLFSGGSAALLGLSLALYQNAGAMLSLKDVAIERFMAQGMASEQSSAPLALAQSILENGKVYDAAARRAMEGWIAGALISGALNVIEKYRKASYQPIDVWMDDEAADDAGFRFSAGATGAMMGATIGCVVPLAEKSATEVLGFASSVVVGLKDSGLRSLGANALVSVITSGVQNFLNASSVDVSRKSLTDGSPSKFLNEAKPQSIFEDDLRERLFTRRMDAVLTS